MKYSSDNEDKLFQSKPEFLTPSAFRPKGWTGCVAGYIREAKQLSMCLLRNQKLMGRPYTWTVHLNINIVQTPSEIKATWAKVTRNLRRLGLCCIWVREVNRLNKVHYHFIIKSQVSRIELRQVFERSMPPRSDVKWRMKIEPITSQVWLCNYVAKAKIKGRLRCGKRKGEIVPDLHMMKRRLFKPNLGIKKYNHIGPFWEKPKKKLWQDICEIEKQIAEGLESPGIKELVDHVYDLVGGTVPKKQLQRSFAHQAHTQSIQDWVGTLIASEQIS